MTKSKLQHLRKALGKLQKTRQSVRWGTAALGGIIALLSTLISIYAIDYLFELSILQRLIIFAISAATIVWSVKRFVLPHTGTHESLLEMALMVEHQHGIESDLVGALQFETAEAKNWGSVNLETAVIDYVADLGSDIDVFAGLDTHSLKKRFWYTASILVLLAIIIIASPSSFGVYLSRLALSQQHYPTSTILESIEVSGIQLESKDHKYLPIKLGYGQPLQFKIIVKGTMPESGNIRLFNSNREMNNLELFPSDTDQAVYLAELPRLLEPLTYQIFLGDAWTAPAEIKVIPLPILQPSLRATPPAYASSEQPLETRNLQATVMRGSQIKLEVNSSKPLQKMTLLYQDQEEQKSISMIATDQENTAWSLPKSTSPFDVVIDPIRFEIQAIDRDGLTPQYPLRGYLRLKADRRPTVACSLVHQVALPDATPLLDFRVDDDHGLASLQLQVQVERQMINSETKEIEILQNQPVLNSDLPLSDQYEINLSQFNLKKNDRLRFILSATDYRGSFPGETTLSEPLVLEISDESGVLAAISEADEKSEEQLTEIIKRQLGIGENP